MSKEEIKGINKIKILQRLKKIEGQVRGIQAMILNERSCEEILVQVSAVSAALYRINKLVLEEKVNACFNYSEELSLSQNTIDEIMNLMIKFLR